jgi:hypothetical protein
MSASTTTIQPYHPTPLDDELAALTLQLEEFGLASESSKGKHPIDNPPDFEVAFASFQAELEQYRSFLNDQILAQSIGAAVHTDVILIGNITSQDIQAHDDRRYALQLSNNDPNIEAPPRHVDTCDQSNVEGWVTTVTSTIAAHSVIDFSDEETEAGPSMTYTECQADTMMKLATEFACTACTGRFPRTNMVTATCSHRYCADCAKKLFMRSTKDEELYPPRCCKQPIPLVLVAKHLDAKEVATFELASVEFTTQNRIEERAEEIVARDAPPDLLPHQWRERVDQVFAELQDNYECEHSRRFQRIDFGKPRRGFRCEMCDARHHRYILQCRHCLMNVCEECRRNRI